MSTVSRITVEGYLASDVQVRQTSSGPVADVVIPHTRRRKNKQTDQFEDAGPTTWFKAAFWKDDTVKAQGLTKGTRVIVTGELEVEPYSKGDGTAGANAVLLFASIAVVPDGNQSQQRPQQPAQQQWDTPAPANQAGDVWGAPGTTYNDETPF